MELRRWALVLICFLLTHSAQGQTTRAYGSIRGTIRTTEGPAVLSGVKVQAVRDDGVSSPDVVFSDDSGNFQFPSLPAGTFWVIAELTDFQSVRQQVVVVSNQTSEIEIRLPVAGLEEQVEVSGDQSNLPESGSARRTIQGKLIDELPVPDDDFSNLLPLLPGVVRGTDGRLHLKGGQATQSSLVVNSSTNVTDPSTGNFGFNLPVDAVASLNVLPNPYSAEFGRFSAGVTNILTREGTDKWKFTVTSFLPRPKFRDGTIMGISSFTPRFGFSGPLVKDRVRIAQTFQYRFKNTRIPSDLLPELERDTLLESFASFTQLDAKLNERHSLESTISVFPMKLTWANLNSFNPQEVTPNFHQRGYNIGLTERFVMAPSTVLESTLNFKRYDVDIFGQGDDEMVITPDGNQGNFFNLQRRKTRTLQWIERLSHVHEGKTGQHVLKFGIDLLQASFDGLSDSRPINVLREDGSLMERITFEPASSQRVRSTDLAFFAQDGWRLNKSLLLELGFRLDRDGVLKRFNPAPRLGFIWELRPEGLSILRGGAGIFYNRTPLSQAAFASYEARTVSAFLLDGSIAGSPLTFRNVAADKRKTPSSFTWNLEYDHRFTKKLLFRANYLHREGRHEPIIDPVFLPSPLLYLDNRGRSEYRELELSSRYDFTEDSHAIVAYVRSKSERDLNDFDGFFGDFRDPLIRLNQYSLSNIDVPHRLLAQTTSPLPAQFVLTSVFELRTGFPYSTVNEGQAYVGPRNRAGRFPNLVTLDIGIQRWITVFGFKTRFGVRMYNIMNTFNPRDFQGNLASPQFGTFYNTVKRTFSLTLQIEP